jgi:molecular chaperone DnaK
MQMAPVIGIDLGTTNTVVAVVKDGHATAIPDENGNTLLPSVVSFHPSGSVLVGRPAKERRLVDAANTIYSVKRLIGRSWESEEVSRARTRFAFQMREGPGQATLVVGRGETYTLPEISAFVLRRAKQVAEAALGTTIDRAVITVPANFNDLQRAATKVAGRVAGLEVLRILNEPTAAALAYGFGRSTAERLAVYDFGGGTFDVTLLDLSDNVFEVLATAGNTFLGGDDIDLSIAERMATEFLSQHRYDPRTNPQTFERLRVAAEQVKQRLSTEQETSVTLEDVAHGTGGKSLGFTFRLSRSELEHLARPLVERTFDVCQEALGIARLTPQDFDQVLLVGGSTRMPLVRGRVEEFFGRELKSNISPDEVVALGAAIQASALAGAERRRGVVPPAPAAARGPLGSAPGIAPNRIRAETIPGVAPPNTQSFGERRRANTSPGVQPDPRVLVTSMPDEPAMGVIGRKAPLGTDTLDGLGARGKIRTGAGLGASAESASQQQALPRAPAAPTLQSAAEQALRAQAGASEPLPEQEEPTVRGVVKHVPATTEESVAYALVDSDIEDITQIPQAAKLARGAIVEPGSSPYAQEDIITKAGDADFTEDEPTKVGRVATQPMPAAAAPATQPLAPAAGRTAPLPAGGPGHTARIPTPFGGQTAPMAAAAGRTAPIPLAAPFPPPAEPPPSVPPPPGYHAPPPAPAPASSRTFSDFGQLPQPLAQPVAPPLTVSSHPPPAPLLVDVTPLTLAVETVRGYCDPIIARNTQVPCEERREFVTASDGQTVVRVRVSQGESKRFSENTLLGEVELSGLPAAPRGSVQISVCFGLDSNGMLNVSATEVQTGRATAAQLRLIGLPEAHDVTAMATRQNQRQTA